MHLELTAEEAMILFETLDDEHRCLINEYDPVTARRPSKRRMGNLDTITSAITKLLCRQPKIAATHYVDLDAIVPCVLELDDKETACVASLLSKRAKDYRNVSASYPLPHTGVIAEIDQRAEVLEMVVARIA